MVPASNTLADWTPISAIPVAPEIAPVLLTPPEKCGILRSSMPAEPAEMVPALLMPPVNVVARLTSMPVIAEMIPALLMPPRNFDAVTHTPARDALLNWLASSIRMPWLVASRLPLTTITPIIVLSNKAMPVFAVIVPLLTMSPVNDDTVYCCGMVAEPSLIPTPPAESVPLLVMPPAKVETVIAAMPVCAARIVPVLTTPPEITASASNPIAVSPAARIAPRLTTPPERFAMSSTKMPA